MPIKEVLPDGTKVYTNGFRYTPVPEDKRKYRKFPPGTQWMHGKPFGPLPVLPDDDRELPWTRPDSEAIDTHKLGCMCRMCRDVDRVKRLKQVRLLRTGR
jgi:hypothetical protein